MFPRNGNRNEGTFGYSPGTKTGTRVRSHVPPERKPERGHVRQPHFSETALLSPSDVLLRAGLVLTKDPKFRIIIRGVL